MQGVRAHALHHYTGRDGSRIGPETALKPNMASAEESGHTAAAEAPPPKLADLLDSGWRLYEELERSSEPTNSEAVQLKVKRGIKQLQDAVRMVSQLELFR